MMIRWGEHSEQGVQRTTTPLSPSRDQWTNSPFMGQQFGNWSICQALWAKRKPIVHATLYPTHISFIPSQSTFLFLKYGYQKFYLENARSSSWVRQKFEVTTWAQHPMDSHPFMSIHPLISMKELYKHLTFKIQGQSHSSRYNILSTHIPFIPCWLALPFPRCSYLKNWPWKPKRTRSWMRSQFKVTMWV